MDDKQLSIELIENNPGLDRVFSCCNEQWTASKKCPPGLICPKCGGAMLDEHATIQELIEWRDDIADFIWPG